MFLKDTKKNPIFFEKFSCAIIFIYLLMLIFVLGANNYEHMQHYKNNNKKNTHTERVR